MLRIMNLMKKSGAATMKGNAEFHTTRDGTFLDSSGKSLFSLLGRALAFSKLCVHRSINTVGGTALCSKSSLSSERALLSALVDADTGSFDSRQPPPPSFEANIIGASSRARSTSVASGCGSSQPEAQAPEDTGVGSEWPLG